MDPQGLVAALPQPRSDGRSVYGGRHPGAADRAAARSVSQLGFRIGNFAYSPDVNGFPPDSFEALEGLDVWMIDCLRDKPHPSHAACRHDHGLDRAT